MEIKENPSNDTMAVVTADPAPVVVAMAVGEGNSNEVNDHGSSCVLSNVCSNVNSSSTPSKKAVDKELRQPFPVKVYEMLENAEEKQFSHIVSWNEAGTGFMVHDKDHFTKEIVPHYFNLTKYKSFQRQLSLYGFQRVTVGQNKGLRYHEKLRKGQLELVRQMKPVGYKPRNLTRLLEQKKQQQQQQQQLGRATNILTTTTTTVVKTTTTSTTLVANDQSKNPTNAISTAANAIIDNAAPLCRSPLSNLAATSLPPVVSSNSLIKHDDHKDNTLESKKQQGGQKNYEVHSISPETTYRNPIHQPSSAGSDVASGHPCSHIRNVSQLHIEQQNSNQAGPKAEPEIVDFEGMCFYLMSPTRELGINVKLKLLEEFNPASSLLRLASKYVTAGYANGPNSPADHSTPTIPETIPITIDTVQDDRPSLLEPFTDIVSTAAATSTASTIAALQTAVANSAAYEPIPTSTPSLLSSEKSDAALETRCMDALDFHSINVANRI